MRTLEVRNGDLALGPGGFALLSGRAKVKQDLAIAVREPLGCDRFHPNWGSVLPDLVGGISNADDQGKIIAEINRLIRNYTAIQGDRLSASFAAGVKPTFTNDEVIASVNAINVVASEDSYYVKISLTTMANQSVSLVTSVGI